MTDKKHPPIKSFAEYQTELASIAHANAEKEKLERLRDEFAMAALNGSISADTGDNIPMDFHVRFAWQVADAMMEARKK